MDLLDPFEARQFRGFGDPSLLWLLNPQALTIWWF